MERGESFSGEGGQVIKKSRMIKLSLSQWMLVQPNKMKNEDVLFAKGSRTNEKKGRSKHGDLGQRRWVELIKICRT